MYMVCLDVSILSETTGKCNMGCHMRHFSLVWSLAITLYSMGSTLSPPCHHLLILAVNPAQRVITDRGAGGEHEKNIPTNSGKKTLLKSSLTCSTSSIQKSLADFGTQLPKCGSTNERMAGLDGHNVTKMLLKLQILPFPYLKV